MEDREFNAAELQFLLSVFRRACADVGSVDDYTRFKIANRILGMTRDGERDFEAIRRYATNGLCYWGHGVNLKSPPTQNRVVKVFFNKNSN